MFGKGMTTVSDENYHLDGPLRTIHIHVLFCQKLHSALAQKRWSYGCAWHVS